VADEVDQRKRIESLEEELRTLRLENEKNVRAMRYVLHVLTYTERGCGEIQREGKLLDTGLMSGYRLMS
jgi:hypothetical protein